MMQTMVFLSLLFNQGVEDLKEDAGGVELLALLVRFCGLPLEGTARTLIDCWTFKGRAPSLPL